MDTAAIIEIVKTGADLVSHFIKQANEAPIGHEHHVAARFKAYAQSVYDQDRKTAEDILAKRQARGEIK